jgi:hypothetical protein
VRLAGAKEKYTPLPAHQEAANRRANARKQNDRRDLLLPQKLQHEGILTKIA